MVLATSKSLIPVRGTGFAAFRNYLVLDSRVGRTRLRADRSS